MPIELIGVAAGLLLLLVAALVKGGSSKVTWLLFRIRLGWLLTAALALLLIVVALLNLAQRPGHG